MKKYVLKYFAQIKARKFRRMLRGHRRLKDNANLAKIMDIKNILATKHCIKSGHVSKEIAGSVYEKNEMIVRQYMLLHFAGLNLNKSILYTLGKHEALLVHPLPKIWCQVIQENNINVAFIRSQLLWLCYMIAFYVNGIKTMAKIIVASILESIRKEHMNLGKYVYFADLFRSNLPSKCDTEYSYDIITWYLRSKRKIDDIDSICHNVQCTDNKEYVDEVAIRQISSVIPPLDRPGMILRYISWSFKISAVALLDLIRGRWGNALLLGQAAKSRQVIIQNKNRLACEYYFHNKNCIYRPLWTYEIENKNIKVYFYFYSTNVEDFKRKDGYINSSFGWQNLDWPHYLVWDEYQKQFIRRYNKKSRDISVVGPIWFYGAKKGALPNLPSNAIIVFDISPFRTSLYKMYCTDFEYYIENNCIGFLEHIRTVANECGCPLVWKRKRDAGSMVHPKYTRYVNSITNGHDVIAVDYRVSAYELIKEGGRVISIPFTSTALIARSMSKPSIYYDPYGMIQKDDRSAHGISVLTGTKELRNWVEGTDDDSLDGTKYRIDNTISNTKLFSSEENRRYACVKHS